MDPKDFHCRRLFAPLLEGRLQCRNLAAAFRRKMGACVRCALTRVSTTTTQKHVCVCTKGWSGVVGRLWMPNSRASSSANEHASSRVVPFSANNLIFWRYMCRILDKQQCTLVEHTYLQPGRSSAGVLAAVESGGGSEDVTVRCAAACHRAFWNGSRMYVVLTAERSRGTKSDFPRHGGIAPVKRLVS